MTGGPEYAPQHGVREGEESPDLAVGWYDAALVWDGHARRGWLVGSPEGVQELRSRLEEGGKPGCGATDVARVGSNKQEYDGHELVKQERMPNGKVKLILKDKTSGKISQRFVDG